MRSQLIVVLLVGLAASTYAYHLSDAKKRSVETDARFFEFFTDLYADVIYQPLNHIVTNLALLAAQVLAGISQTGIPAPGGRMIHPSAARLRGFFDDFWNNALRPPLENAIQGLSLLAAQALAGIGVNGINLNNLGKRGTVEDEARFLDTLNDVFNDLFTNVIQKPLEDALSGGALMLAQLLAGIGTNGINLGSIFGQRVFEDEARFFDMLNDVFNDLFTNVIQKPLEDALSGGALMLAQLLAGIGTNGIDLGSIFGKQGLNELAARQQELRGFFDDLGNNLLSGLQGVWTNILQNPLEQALQSGALMAAQLLAGIGVNGINLNNLGKRELQAEPRGEIIDSLVEHASGLYVNQIKPIIENALNGVALHLAGVLADFSQNGFGRR